MKLTRIYTGDDGESHFSDEEIPLKDQGHVGQFSEWAKATGVLFRAVQGDYNYDFHCAPRRQYIVNLTGSVEIEVGSGDKRVFGPGDIMLVEDTHGHGHISRAVNNENRTCIFISTD